MVFHLFVSCNSLDMKITNPKTFVMFKNIELSKHLIHSRSFQWGSELPLLTAVRPGHSQPNNINEFYCQSYRMAILICFSHLACILICCAQKRFVRNPQFNPFNFLGSEKHNLRSVIICLMRVEQHYHMLEEHFYIPEERDQLYAGGMLRNDRGAGLSDREVQLYGRRCAVI